MRHTLAKIQISTASYYEKNSNESQLFKILIFSMKKYWLLIYLPSDVLWLMCLNILICLLCTPCLLFQICEKRKRLFIFKVQKRKILYRRIKHEQFSLFNNFDLFYKCQCSTGIKFIKKNVFSYKEYEMFKVSVIDLQRLMRFFLKFIENVLQISHIWPSTLGNIESIYFSGECCLKTFPPI